MSSRGHACWLVRLAVDPAVEESLVAELWRRGTLGLETREVGARIELDAYFESEVSKEKFGAGAGVEVIAIVPVADRDWLAAYRECATPFALGSGFAVDPGEPGQAKGGDLFPGRTLLRLPARRAFGTGSHESTALVVELLEDELLAGRSVLDVGCGSGILAVVARSLGAGRVVGVEVDPVAACAARENQRLNRARFELVAGTAACLAGEHFDLVLVNVLPEVIAPDLPAILELTAAGGRVILSGLLTRDRAAVVERLSLSGWHPIGDRRSGEWLALLCAAAH